MGEDAAVVNVGGWGGGDKEWKVVGGRLAGKRLGGVDRNEIKLRN